MVCNTEWWAHSLFGRRHHRANRYGISKSVRQNANTCASKYVDIAFEREKKKTKKKTQNTTVFEAQNEMMD